VTEIEKLVNAPDDLNRMEGASRKLAHGDAAAAAVDMIEELKSKGELLSYLCFEEFNTSIL
jgi:UDP-N-acetylglucosamine:LPS N-acetylglucosamine transferase